MFFIMKTTLNIQTIANAGGSIIISATKYTPLNLQTIANACKSKGSKLIVKDADKLTTLNCQTIASTNPGNVFFDFT